MRPQLQSSNEDATERQWHHSRSYRFWRWYFAVLHQDQQGQKASQRRNLSEDSRSQTCYHPGRCHLALQGRLLKQLHHSFCRIWTCQVIGLRCLKSWKSQKSTETLKRCHSKGIVRRGQQGVEYQGHSHPGHLPPSRLSVAEPADCTDNTFLKDGNRSGH